MLTPYLIGMWKVENLSSEVQFWWTDDVAEMPEIQSIRKDWCLFLGGFLVWYYMFILITCFFILALERTCASYFIQNYEKTSRSYIFILLFLFQHGMVLVMLWFCFFNRIAFSLCFLFTFSLNAFAVLLLWANRQYNVILIRKFERNTKKSVEMYTLPARFQAKENVKAFDLTLRILIVGFFLLFTALFFLVFLNYKWLPSCGTFFLFCFENMVHLNPLIVCPAMILSVYPWRKRLSRWKITRSVSCSTSQKELLGQGMGQQQETDFYFNQLNVSWERHVK
ncbi:hypothetical protein B9Z55_006889 [Caenorhabditis nigoni]|uniref:Serpentine receptor class gamma n=2 Tax=Caenorhabditis nigoni TaxID=1611254 RepID=A0A2G5V783_9PELO|nr:hypothetical protein B9Z55_006889 [Caenorhabditis nigoni]